MPTELAVRFTDTAEQEMRDLIIEMKLIPLADYIHTSKESLPPELSGLLTHMLIILKDIFSIDLPDVKDPETTLRTVSRDINLSRILRERGLFRLYRLVHSTDENGVPLFMGIMNPVFGHPFAKQEEFIGWFCEEAKISRGTVFRRLAAIERTVTLGFTLEQSFDMILHRPFVIGETLSLLAEHGVVTWDKGQIADVDPEMALKLAEQINPAAADDIRNLVGMALEDADARDELKDAIKPILAGLLTEVTLHDRSKDALAHVKHEVLSIPEISYSWDKDGDYLIVELHRKEIDPETGEEAMSRPIVVPFIPDVTELPIEVKSDIIRRLPIKNRLYLDI